MHLVVMKLHESTFNTNTFSMCALNLKTWKWLSKPHHGDKPHKCHQKKLKPCSQWIRFQPQITNYRKLIFYNKYLTFFYCYRFKELPSIPWDEPKDSLVIKRWYQTIMNINKMWNISKMYLSSNKMQVGKRKVTMSITNKVEFEGGK
jgi:hypothetical protein